MKIKNNLDKKIIYIISVFGGLVLVSFCYFLYHYLTTGLLTTKINPQDTVFTIDNKRYTGNVSKLSLHTGNYKVTFTRSGFLPVSKDITISTGKETIISLILKPLSITSSFDTLSQTDKIQAVDDAISDLDGAKFQKDNPLIQSLPVFGDNYIIDFDATTKPITIKISIMPTSSLSTDSIKKTVLSWIKSQNVNPDNLNIKYIISDSNTNE